MTDVTPTPGMKFCSSCGNKVLVEAEICMNCGVRLRNAGSSVGSVGPSGKSRLAYALFYLFLGPLGVHDFYIGRTVTGIVWLVATITVIGAFVTIPLAFIMGVLWLIRSDDEFETMLAKS
jgi:TM2 domain-containing membrane protein YozV